MKKYNGVKLRKKTTLFAEILAWLKDLWTWHRETILIVLLATILFVVNYLLFDKFVSDETIIECLKEIEALTSNPNTDIIATKSVVAIASTAIETTIICLIATYFIPVIMNVKGYFASFYVPLDREEVEKLGITTPEKYGKALTEILTVKVLNNTRVVDINSRARNRIAKFVTEYFGDEYICTFIGNYSSSSIDGRYIIKKKGVKNENL